jgi:hypothetical protein
VKETDFLPVFPTGSLQGEHVSLVLHCLLPGLMPMSSWHFICGRVRNLVKREIVSGSRLLLGQSARAKNHQQKMKIEWAFVGMRLKSILSLFPKKD